MTFHIKWTPRAEKGLEEVLVYLKEKWTFREIRQLKNNIQRTIKHISLNPELYPSSKKYKDLRKAIVDKNNYLVYRINKQGKTIIIINFRGTKQKIKY